MIKVTYILKCNTKQAPVMTTDSRQLAHTELNDALRKAQKGEFFHLEHEIETVEPVTNDERYLLLVHETRKAIRHYYHNGRKQEDLRASTQKENQLMKWNMTIRDTLNKHPEIVREKQLEQTAPYRFFLLVEKWLPTWKSYHELKRKKASKAQINEVKNECFYFERQIDDYIYKTLKL